MLPLLAQLTEAITTIDRAEKASDRWLFLASIVFIMFIGTVIIRYLIKSGEVKDAAHSIDRNALYTELKTEREECRKVRQDDQDKFLLALSESHATIEVHTKALTALTGVITKHDSEIRAAHELELRAMIRSEIDSQYKPK